jgi:hypothetical protein
MARKSAQKGGQNKKILFLKPAPPQSQITHLPIRAFPFTI